MECKKCNQKINENNKYGKGIFCSKKCQLSFAFENNKKQAIEKSKTKKTLERVCFLKNCKKCNKEFNVERGINKDSSIHIFKNEKNFCSRSCANSRGPQNEKTKNKVKLTLKNTLKLKSKQNKNLIEKICKNCLCTFKVNYNKRNQIFCSNNCNCKYPVSNETKEKLSILAKKRVKDGVHKGWQTRNIKSYPEKFFIKVLNNNKIKYLFNFPIKKKDLKIKCSSCYFLDFYFPEIKLNLEIDGKQHESRIEHDLKRDELLKNNGITTYRIKWKNINTQIGKEYIKNEIEKFLNYYHKKMEVCLSG